MGTTSELDLVTLARTDAGKFLQAFIFKLVEENPELVIGIQNIEAIMNLDENEVVDGLHLECVHQEGGHEGGGEYVERVLAVRRGPEVISHIRITGYYASYAGTDYNDDWTIVQPREVTVTQYFEVKS